MSDGGDHETSSGRALMVRGHMTEHETSRHEPGSAATESTDPPDHSAAACAQFQRAIEFIGRRWVGAILYVLLGGPCRFNELLARVPNLSDRLLTERLRELEAAGMVSRDVQPGPPVRVVYALTEAGRSLSGIIRSVEQWAREWGPGVME